MNLTPDEIERREFSTGFRGYDKAEVRQYLRRVARQLRDAENELAPDGDVAGETSAPAVTGGEVGPMLDLTGAAVPTALAGPADAPVPEPVPADEFVIDVDAPPDRGEEGLDHDLAGLGDRIAGLLRRAEESANAIRAGADRDAAEVRRNAELESRTLIDRARAEAADLATQAEARASRLVGQAEADARRLRADAEAEAADIEARARAVPAAESPDDPSPEAVAELEAAEAERARALAEVAEARGQVAALLDEARSQSALIRAEAEEIIRARVRAATEQAMRRVQHLRTTEDASRERLRAAQEELAKALVRLDGEAAPALPDADRDLPEIVAEAEQRSLGLAGDPALPARTGSSEEPLLGADDAPARPTVAAHDPRRPVVAGDPVVAATGAVGEVAAQAAPDQAAEIDRPTMDPASDHEDRLDDGDDREAEPEDALTQLIRNAMQAAVQSARSDLD